MPVSLEDLRQMAPNIHQLQLEAEEDEENTAFSFTDVYAGPEFQRILGLPRREIPRQDDPETIQLAEFLTDRYAKNACPYPGRMRPIVALCLKEAWEQKGLVGMLRVGAGKTFLAFMLPEILQAQRPLIITQAKMIPDMERERTLMRRDWHIRPAHQCPIISYEMLSSVNAGEVLDNDGRVVKKSKLERLAPTVIIMDEAHSYSDSGTTGAKRMERYLRAHPDVIVIVMTGTFFKTSIKDASHLFKWALKERAPLPQDFKERECWARYLDAKKQQGKRVGAGVLTDLLAWEDEASYADAEIEDQKTMLRRAVATRILETPGVIGTQDPPLDVGLEIDNITADPGDPDVEEFFRTLRGDGSEMYPGWRLPDGTELADGMQYARHASTGGFGFYNIWDPSPSEDYRFHRNAWAKWCRKALRYNKMGLDSEARMADAVDRGLINDKWTAFEAGPDGGLVGTSRLENWRDQVAQYRSENPGLLEPPSVPVWFSTRIVDVVRSWLQEVGNGLVWVDSIGLGELLEEHLGIPYYRAGGVDAKGRHIKEHRGGPAVASVKANGTGRNLQGFWSRALWLTPPGEQSLGRIHRAGQKDTVVKNWVYIGATEHLRSFHAAKSTKAAFAEAMQMSPQKLRYALTNMPDEWTLGMTQAKRFERPKSVKES